MVPERNGLDYLSQLKKQPFELSVSNLFNNLFNLTTYRLLTFGQISQSSSLSVDLGLTAIAGLIDIPRNRKIVPIAKSMFLCIF